MRFTKKGSLDLSINAIVILVLAITMLGLGLGFTKGMFAKFASKLDVPEPNYPATAEEPVVLPVDTLTVKNSKDFAFSVNFFNDQTGGTVTPTMVCAGTLSSLSTSIVGSATLPAIAVSSQSVPSGEYKGFKFIIIGKLTTTLAGNMGICTITFTPSTGTPVTKQITVSIT